MRSYVDDLEILGTSTLLIPKEGFGKIVLDDSSPTLTFLFSFAKKDDGKSMSIDYKKEEERTLRITFNNFQNPLGTFHSGHIPIGTYRNRILLFNYHIFLLSEKLGYKCDLFFFLGKEAKP